MSHGWDTLLMLGLDAILSLTFLSLISHLSFFFIELRIKKIKTNLLIFTLKNLHFFILFYQLTQIFF